MPNSVGERWVSTGCARTSDPKPGLLQVGMRYLTGGSDVGYILSAGRADVKRQREVRLS